MKEAKLAKLARREENWGKWLLYYTWENLQGKNTRKLTNTPQSVYKGVPKAILVLEAPTLKLLSLHVANGGIYRQMRVLNRP